MNFVPYLLLLLACFLVTLRYYSRSDSFSSFALSKNTFGSFAIFSTIVASFVGGGTIIGVAEKSYFKGIAPAIGLLGFAVQIYFTGTLIAPRLISKYNKSLTVGDIFSASYGENARILMSVAWFMFCCGIVTAQFASLKYLLHFMCPTNTSLCAIMLAIFVTCYSAAGGIVSVVRTDIIQFAVFVVVLPVSAIMAVSRIASNDILFTSHSTQFFNPFSSTTPLQLFTTIMIFIFADALIPPVVQRILISDDVKVIKSSFKRASLLIIILVCCAASLGFAASWINPSLESNRVIFYTSDTILGCIFKDFFITGLIAVVISSSDSYLNSCSVTITHDVVSRYFVLSDKAKLNYSRAITLLVGAIAIYFSNSDINIVDILIFSYKFWGPIIVVPLLMLFFNVKISIRGFYLSSIVVVLFVILWNLGDFEAKYGIEDIIPSMLLDAILFYSFYKFEGK